MNVPQPDLSIIVVTHNGRDLALRTLRSARAALGSARAEWIVADSASTDGTPKAIEEEFEDIKVLRLPNHGFAAGNNAGIARANGRYVLLLNPDIEIREGNFADLVEALDERPEVGIASVLQQGPGGELQFSMRRFPSPARDLGESLAAAHWPVMRTLQELEVRTDRYRIEASPDWVVGAFLCVRSEAIAEIGPMDEQFFLYSEEIDWCLRARKAGWDVRHLPVMSVTHHAGRRDRGDLMAQLAHSRMLFARKHHRRVSVEGIRLALALGYLLRFLAKLPLAARLPTTRRELRAEGRALGVLFGLSEPPLGSSSRSEMREATIS